MRRFPFLFPSFKTRKGAENFLKRFNGYPYYIKSFVEIYHGYSIRTGKRITDYHFRYKEHLSDSLRKTKAIRSGSKVASEPWNQTFS
jgi:hypothetical protein